jgi:hypothetical protein
MRALDVLNHHLVKAGIATDRPAKQSRYVGIVYRIAGNGDKPVWIFPIAAPMLAERARDEIADKLKGCELDHGPCYVHISNQRYMLNPMRKLIPVMRPYDKYVELFGGVPA